MNEISAATSTSLPVIDYIAILRCVLVEVDEETEESLTFLKSEARDGRQLQEGQRKIMALQSDTRNGVTEVRTMVQRILSDNVAKTLQDMMLAIAAKFDELRGTIESQHHHHSTRATTQVPSRELEIGGVPLSKLKKDLCNHYTSDAESSVTLSIGDKSHPVSVGELFVNMAIVLEATQRQHERRVLTEAQRNPLLAGENGGNEVPPQFDEVIHNIPGGVQAAASNLRYETDQNEGNIMYDSEDIHSEKVTIKPEDLFGEHKVSDRLTIKCPFEILLYGRAGVGKTTLCRYLTHRWSKGEDL